MWTGFAQALSGGSYTINAAGAATSSNYKSFNALFRDLNNGGRNDGGTSNGAGISGPIVIDVVSGSGPYTEQVTINQYSGISSTNSIKINGNGNILQFTATSSAASHTLLLDGADFITIENLTILANSTSMGRCVHLMNDARSNTLNKCTFQMPNMTGTSTANAYVCLTQGTSTMQTYGAAGQDNLITGCTMSSVTNGGPYSAVAVMDASTGSVVRKNTISNNKISNFRNFGIWIYYAFQQTITGNEIFNNSSTNLAAVTYGIYNFCSNKGGDYIIEDNFIHDLNTRNTTQYGIYHYILYGTGSNNVSIKRNKVVLKNLTSSAFGIYVYGLYSTISGNLETDNNQVEMEQTTGSTSTFYGIYNYGAYYSSFKSVTNNSNIVRIKSPYRAYGIIAYVLYNNQLTQKSSFSNNIVDAQINMDLYGGIYYYGFSNKEKTDLCYNTIYSSNLGTGNVTGNKYLMYLYYADGNIMNNNIVSADNGGTTYGIFDYYSTSSFSNNNVFNHKRGTNYHCGARNNSPSTDLASFINNFSDKNAMSIDPIFKNLANAEYQPTSINFVNKGIPVNGYTTDINGAKRNTSNPDLGAIEYYVDVELTRLYFTATKVCGGYKEEVALTFKNTGGDTLKNVPVRYSLPGKEPTVETISKINPFDTAYYKFSKIAEVNGSGQAKLEVELNGNDDVLHNNKKTHDLFITPSPAGFKLIEAGNFDGYFRIGPNGGTFNNPDATIPDKKVVYEIDLSGAKGYTNSNYNSSWVMSGLVVTRNGKPANKSVLLAPSGSGNASLSFEPDASLIDSMVYLGIKVQNISTGCDSVFGRWIYIPHIPKPAFTGTDVCEGNVSVFTNKTSLAKGNAQYLWKFNDKGVSEDSSFLIDPIFNFSTYGIYRVDLYAWNAQFPKFKTVTSQTITVTPIPDVSFKVMNACENAAVKFINNTTLPLAGTVTYNWDFGDPTTNLDKSTTKDASYIYKSAGGYKVTLRATANGCTGELVKNANQFATPKANFNVPALLCDKTEINFTNTSTIKMGNMGYTWSFGDGGVSNFSNPIHQFTGSGLKQIKMKAISEFGCVDSITKPLTIEPAPNADFNWGAACNLSNTNFTFTGTKPASPLVTNFKWDFAGEGTSMSENPSILFKTTGKKLVSLALVSNNGCKDLITKEVVVKLQSKADFTPTDACEGEDAVFTNKSKVASGKLEYVWKFGDGGKSSSASPRHRYNINGVSTTYNVTLVAVVPGGCSDSITKPISINAKPDAGFTYTKSGRMVYFKANQTSGTNYNWRFGDGGNTNEINPQYHYVQFPSGKYTACLSVVNASGCESESCQTINVTGGIQKFTNSTDVQISPNPNTGTFTIKIEAAKPNLSILVFNVLGDVVKTLETNSLRTTYPVDLNVANGIYFVKVTNGNETSTHKITVNK